jgi:hypothetical protein
MKKPKRDLLDRLEGAAQACHAAMILSCEATCREAAEEIARLRKLKEVPSEKGTNAEFVGDVRKIVSDWGADDVGVERFAKAMSTKLAKKRDEGRSGWNREPYTVQPDRGDRVGRFGCTVSDLREMLREHFATGDPVDIANFCMMIWNRENPNG